MKICDHAKRATFLLATLFAMAAASRAQGEEWTRLESGARTFPSVVFDPVRGRTVIFGGELAGSRWTDELLEWDGVALRPRRPASRPAARSEHQAVWDDARAEMLLFGGRSESGLLADTWRWNGMEWSLAATASAPAARSGHGMAFDPLGARVLLFGGTTSAGASSELWQWDGAAWSLLSAFGPAPRAHAGMDFDRARGCVVLHGGRDAQGAELGDTWEWWASTGWLQTTPASGPGPRFAPSVVFDHTLQAIVLRDGFSRPLPQADLWRWDGSTWHLLSTTVWGPGVGTRAACDSVRGRLVFIGPNEPVTQVSEWDGMRTVQTSYPQAPMYGVAVYETGARRVLLYGSGTWSWDGAGWNSVLTGTYPGLIAKPLLANDDTRARVVLLNQRLGTLWEWDGVDWNRSAAAGPPAREGAAITFDAARGRCVLFGGSDPTTFFRFLDDTWEWDGVRWRQRFPSRRPPARAGHGMAFDPIRGKVVLFGGSFFQAGFTDTWEWDGLDWTLLQPPVSPPARTQHAMTFDPLRGRVVVHGGGVFGIPYPATDAWEWDGATWSPRLFASAAPGLFQHSLAFHAARNAFLVYEPVPSGSGYSSLSTWTVRARSFRASAHEVLPGSALALSYDLPACAGSPYLTLLSFGTTPGIDLGLPQVLPLNADALLLSVLASAPVLPTFLGQLDAQGRNATLFRVPDDPALREFSFFAAGMTFDALGVRAVTNEEAVTIR